MEQDSQLCCSPMVREPLSAARADHIATVFKALSDPVRLRLLSLIASHADGEVCACELVGEFHVGQPTISHHLKVLREAGLLTSQRRANWVYYRVPEGAFDPLVQLLDTRGESSPAPA